MYHYVVHRDDCRLLIVESNRKSISRASLVLVLITLIAAIIGLLMYVNQLDLIGKTILHQIYRL
jgi:ABC-type Mn2+/Zn2+ transport system permease subunit